MRGRKRLRKKKLKKFDKWCKQFMTQLEMDLFSVAERKALGLYYEKASTEEKTTHRNRSFELLGINQDGSWRPDIDLSSLDRDD